MEPSSRPTPAVELLSAADSRPVSSALSFPWPAVEPGLAAQCDLRALPEQRVVDAGQLHLLQLCGPPRLPAGPRKGRSPIIVAWSSPSPLHWILLLQSNRIYFKAAHACAWLISTACPHLSFQELGLDGKWICDPCLEELELSRNQYCNRRAVEYEREFMRACAIRIASQWRSCIMLRRFRKKRAAVRLLQARWRRQRCVYSTSLIRHMSFVHVNLDTSR